MNRQQRRIEELELRVAELRREIETERQVRVEDVGCYEAMLDAEREAHAKTREVLRELVEAWRNVSSSTAHVEAMRAAEQHLKETS